MNTAQSIRRAGCAAALGALAFLPGSAPRPEAPPEERTAHAWTEKNPDPRAIALEHAWRSRVLPPEKRPPLSKALSAEISALAAGNPKVFPAHDAAAARAELFRRLIGESEYHLKRSGYLVPLVSEFFREPGHVRDAAEDVFSGAYADYRKMLANPAFMERYKTLSGKSDLEWTPVCNDRAVLFLTAAVLRQKTGLMQGETKAFSIVLGVYLDPRNPERSEYHAWFEAGDALYDPSVDAKRLVIEKEGAFRYVPLVYCNVRIALGANGGFTATHQSELSMLPDEMR